MAIRLVKEHPDYLVIGFDSMEYVASLNNLKAIATLPNFLFIRVRAGARGPWGDQRRNEAFFFPAYMARARGRATSFRATLWST